jgi:lipase
MFDLACLLTAGPDTARPLPPHRDWPRGGDRPVLALHCSLAHAGAWSGLAERLSGITLTGFDQIGHGRAPDWDGLADLHDAATADAIAMALHLGQGRAIDLFGHSFGGTVALRVALMRPDLVRSLMLVEPVLFAAARASGAAAWGAFHADHLRVAELMAGGDRAGAARLFHGLWGTGETLETLPEKARDYITNRIHLIPAQNAVLLDDSKGLLRAGGLEAVSVPVLLVEGAASPPIIAANHAELARRLPQARRASVTGAGHMLTLTHADELAALVGPHLASS